MPKATVTLEEGELQRLEAILIDEDRAAALEYLRTLKQNLDLQARHLCKLAF